MATAPVAVDVWCACTAFTLWYAGDDRTEWCQCGHARSEHLDGQRSCVGESVVLRGEQPESPAVPSTSDEDGAPELTRLTVNLTRRSVVALANAAERDGDIPTDTVNRALQFYAASGAVGAGNSGGEDVYQRAARAAVTASWYGVALDSLDEPEIERMATDDGFRAAVDEAYAAGQSSAAQEIAELREALKVITDGRAKERPFIAIDPAMRSGQPTLNHTRLPVEAVMGVLIAGDSIEQTMENYDVTRADILVTCWYEGIYGSRRSRKQFGAWAKEAHGALWSSKFDEVGDPFEAAGPLQPASDKETT